MNITNKNGDIAVMFVFIAGLGIGAILSLATMAAIPNSMAKVARGALDICEETLPRDQHCVLIAVPKSSKIELKK